MRLQLFLTLALIASPSAFAEKTLQECIDTENDLERLVCYDGIFGHNKGAKLTSLPSTANKSDFGSESLQNRAKEQSDELLSVAVGDFHKWTKDMKISLKNGQVWRITSLNTLVHKIKNPEIKISKGFLGGYKMGIQGVNTRLAVKRIK